MKTRTYRNGTTTCRSYLKNVGNGWEVGFTYAGKPLFVGNFIHSTEANQWYGVMNAEIRTFTKKYKVGPGCPKSWYFHFVKSHLYDKYYHFLGRKFTGYTKNYRRAVSQSQRTYRRMARRWTPTERTHFLKAA